MDASAAVTRTTSAEAPDATAMASLMDTRLIT